ncbi:Protein-ribulosamine 3-kinase, chloroplastic [Colletotrichum tanaceti]|uniref:protein-ribulosamine 3-kinase n=1 Tax=Colletotrichum tanaceti TaxID=1306861 RepID=A0A4U6XJ08_9PEZI|nr:Protein-ribulosamine 3-kinase, chloroplastic [Colletotrichum tanaceti]
MDPSELNETHSGSSKTASIEFGIATESHTATAVSIDAAKAGIENSHMSPSSAQTRIARSLLRKAISSGRSVAGTAKTHELCRRIAAIHRDSVSPVPDQFGFTTPTYHDTFPQPVANWSSSWCDLFEGMLRHLSKFESDLHGDWLTAQTGFQHLVDQTVRNILMPLQAHGRYLKPCLVHGNLSYGNIAVNRKTRSPTILDPAALFAHNEFELEDDNGETALYVEINPSQVL